MPKKLTNKEFIEKAKIIHGDKYDYSKVEYVNAKTKVCIICPKHGEFWQTPDKHLQGHQCIYCNNKRKPSEEDYINKINKIHNYKYDYSKLTYKNKVTKICVICHEKDEYGEEHGEFFVTAHNHLHGCGCPKCAKKYRYTTEEWIEKAKKKHPLENYDYSKVLYKDNRTKVCIICLEHGEFWQTPYKHLHGCGCPKCKNSKLEESTEKILKKYNIIFEYQKRFKWLKQQSLDFYLPEYNIAIECQGEQHFKPVDFAGKGKEWANIMFKKTLKRDENKYNLCKKHDIIIEYINFDEDVNNKLLKIIKNYE